MSARRGWGTSRGRGQQSWRSVAADSSPHPRSTGVGADASSNSSVSSTSDSKSDSSSQPRGFGSHDDVKHRESITPSNPRGRGGGWSSFGGRNYSNEASERHLGVSFKVGSGSDIVQNGVSNKASEATVASSLNLDRSFIKNIDKLPDRSCLSEEREVGKCHSEAKGSESTNLCGNENSDNSGCSVPIERFDICPPKSGSLVVLKPTLMARNREKRNLGELKGIILRHGMLLWKNYLSSSEQILVFGKTHEVIPVYWRDKSEIVQATVLRICRNHGLGPAGFYQPRFRDGGELHLKMMCFGEFWDCETNKYGELRPMDGAKPPNVPSEFLQLVDRAMKDSRSLIAQHSKVKNVEDILPPVKPDICLVNYYATTGRLGLHQDKDESQESLRKGLPVVSFSIGDAAEFLYSDVRDVDKAEKITLKSGDVLIFGGKSRHVIHGVSAIQPGTAPISLLEETNFSQGRLNLTFRQHL